jgi:uncharacterized protein (DUF1800 family)
MKKTSIALCAVLFGALVVSNVFAEETLVANNEAAANETGAVVEGTTGDVATAEATTGDVETGAVAEATTGDVETGAVAEATTGDVETGAVAEATTGDVETGAVAEAATGEAETSINDQLHAILDKYFEDNAKKFKSAELKKNFFETVKANIKKAAENARASQKKAFDILVDALETYELK